MEFDEMKFGQQLLDKARERDQNVRIAIVVMPFNDEVMYTFHFKNGSESYVLNPIAQTWVVLYTDFSKL